LATYSGCISEATTQPLPSSRPAMAVRQACHGSFGRKDSEDEAQAWCGGYVQSACDSKLRS
jgi:hypothetical protein